MKGYSWLTLVQRVSKCLAVISGVQKVIAAFKELTGISNGSLRRSEFKERVYNQDLK